MADKPAPSANEVEVQKLKTEANGAFSAKKWEEASKLYTAAIVAGTGKDDVLPRTMAILFSNRAACQLKLENNGSACLDAKEAIKLDRTYVKSYYRLGSAEFAIGRHNASIAAFKKVIKIAPNDKSAKAQLKTVQKEAMRIKFEKAIESHLAPSQEMNPDDISVPSSYDGPAFEDTSEITAEWVMALMERFKSQKDLHRKYALKIILAANTFFKNEPVMIERTFPDGEYIKICGDTHGQFYDLLNLFQKFGNPSETNRFLFNGDFVDRGSFSIEVIMTLLAWKLCYPDHFFMARGNHESHSMTQTYGFQGECKHKYNESTYDLFLEMFQSLPLAHLWNEKVLCVHGGLFSEDGVTLDQIRKINRFAEPPHNGLMCDIMWSDPQEAPGRAPSKRGVGISFGPDVTERFLDANNLECLVRSHEVKAEGYESMHNGRCITIFSAPNYCDQMGNKAAVVKFTAPEMKPEFTQFTNVPHPNIPPMAYVSNQQRMMM